MAVDQSLPRGFTLFLMMLLALNGVSTACISTAGIGGPEETGLIAAILAGFFCVGPLSDQYGRRKVLILLALFNLAASICLIVFPNKSQYFQIAAGFTIPGYLSLAYAIAAKTDETPTGSITTFLLTALFSTGAILFVEPIQDLMFARIRNGETSGAIVQIVLTSLLFLTAVIFLDSKDRVQVPFPSTLRLYCDVLKIQTFRSFGFVILFAAITASSHFLGSTFGLLKFDELTYASILCISFLLGILLGSISRGERAAVGASVILTVASFVFMACSSILLFAPHNSYDTTHIITIFSWICAASSAFALFATGLLVVTSTARALITAKEFPGTAVNTLIIFLQLGLIVTFLLFLIGERHPQLFGIVAFVSALFSSMIARRA